MGTRAGDAVRAEVDAVGRALAAVVTVLPEGPAIAGPLSGTAVAVKDMIDVAGQPRGNGNPEDMAGPPRTADASAVRALRSAGADVVALTALLEYAAGAQHPDLPEARNPVDPRRTAGGSSGGSAALVGAGAVRSALGTDTGGSVRLPAHYCGAVGLKPSFGALPLDGVQALAPSLDHLGVLARDVASAAAVFGALAGRPRPAPAAGRLRVGVLRGWIEDARTTPEVAAVVAAAVRRIGAAHDLIEVDAAPLDALNEVFGDIVLFEAATVHGDALRARPTHFGAPTRRLLETATAVGEDRYASATGDRERLVPVALALLGGLDVLAGPAAPYVAPVESPPIDTPEGEVESVFSAPANVSGQPALVLPAGRTADGLPVGLQLLGAPGGDERLLAVALRIEEALGAVTPM